MSCLLVYNINVSCMILNSMSNTSIEDKAEVGLESEGEPTLSKHLQ